MKRWQVEYFNAVIVEAEDERRARLEAFKQMRIEDADILSVDCIDEPEAEKTT